MKISALINLKRLLGIVLLALSANNFSHAQSVHFFKTSEALEIQKKDASAHSSSELVDAINQELLERRKQSDKINELQQQLDKKLATEAYFEADAIKAQLNGLKSYSDKLNELRNGIESSLASENYEKAEEFKTALISEQQRFSETEAQHIKDLEEARKRAEAAEAERQAKAAQEKRIAEEKQKQEKIKNLERELNEKLEAEDYFAADKIKTALEQLKADNATSNSETSKKTNTETINDAESKEVAERRSKQLEEKKRKEQQEAEEEKQRQAAIAEKKAEEKRIAEELEAKLAEERKKAAELEAKLAEERRKAEELAAKLAEEERIRLEKIAKEEAERKRRIEEEEAERKRLIAEEEKRKLEEQRRRELAKKLEEEAKRERQARYENLPMYTESVIEKIYSETFDDGKVDFSVSSIIDRWKGPHNGAYESRQYGYDYPGFSYTTLSINFDEERDFSISSNVLYIKGDMENYMGIIWGAKGNSLFLFGFNKKGTITISEYEGGRLRKEHLTEEKFPAIKDNWTNVLKVAKIGNEWVFVINDKEIHRMPYNGMYGINSGFLLPNNATARFDNFSINYIGK